ncbi:hypothetical protein AWV79_01115 [Cupriavidus sp. UYMMa02A]|nr:hypothetical protein AWV79_01115 [Cupriavidus sp. UYMMa02A]
MAGLRMLAVAAIAAVLAVHGRTCRIECKVVSIAGTSELSGSSDFLGNLGVLEGAFSISASGAMMRWL